MNHSEDALRGHLKDSNASSASRRASESEFDTTLAALLIALLLYFCAFSVLPRCKKI